MTATQDSPSAWYCVRTQTKREHIAAKHLRELEGVEAFCPRLRYRKATRRGKIWWVEPLFPGYLLARFQIAEMERAVTFCQGVRGLVRFGAEIPPVPDSFVSDLKHEIISREDADEEMITVPPAIELGEEIEMASGPLSGMRGTVISIMPATERVKVLLDFLGRPQTIDVDLFSILLPRKPLP